MSILNAVAKSELKAAGISQAEWARRHFLDGRWHGDACGCPDDRCIGYHHDATDGCGCLPAVLAELAAVLAELAAATTRERNGGGTVNNNDERDYGEERYNEQLIREEGETGDPAAGPLETESQARELPAVRAVYDAGRASNRRGVMGEANCVMLWNACDGAGIDLGDYDRRILAWLANFEPETCAVVAGLITRAARQREPDREIGT